ncbi:RmlC-like cupin domain-containing protein [Mycena sanguinolenta]|nr:RmlC-like cupin domain-containing protein [Mycena sanguinolenta]
MTTPVDSPTLNPLVKELGLLKHPEGGYFLETDRQRDEVPSPFADGSLRSLATAIYYLLDYDSPSGVIHMNKSVTYHVLHQGRVEYTLITPGNPPTVEKKVMGTGPNETRQLLVGTGVWKMSKLLPDDLAKAKTDEEKKNLGCLITEVVVPGFHWEDHKFLLHAELVELLKDVPDKESLISELAAHVKKGE